MKLSLISIIGTFTRIFILWHSYFALQYYYADNVNGYTSDDYEDDLLEEQCKTFSGFCLKYRQNLMIISTTKNQILIYFFFWYNSDLFQ